MLNGARNPADNPGSRRLWTLFGSGGCSVQPLVILLIGAVVGSFVAVRFLYLPWENTAGLPAQLVMSATRTGAAEGAIKVDEQ